MQRESQTKKKVRRRKSLDSNHLLYFLGGLASAIMFYVVFLSGQSGYCSAARTNDLRYSSNCAHCSVISNDSIHGYVKYSQVDSLVNNRLEHLLKEERLKVGILEKRFDDLYIAAGWVITLMLVILAGVYLRVRNEAAEFLDNNLETYVNQFEEDLEKVQKYVAQITAEYETIVKLRNNSQSGDSQQVEPK